MSGFKMVSDEPKKVPPKERRVHDGEIYVVGGAGYCLEPLNLMDFKNRLGKAYIMSDIFPQRKQTLCFFGQLNEY